MQLLATPTVLERLCTDRPIPSNINPSSSLSRSILNYLNNHIINYYYRLDGTISRSWKI